MFEQLENLQAFFESGFFVAAEVQPPKLPLFNSRIHYWLRLDSITAK